MYNARVFYYIIIMSFIRTTAVPNCKVTVKYYYESIPNDTRSVDKLIERGYMHECIGDEGQLVSCVVDNSDGMLGIDWRSHGWWINNKSIVVFSNGVIIDGRGISTSSKKYKDQIETVRKICLGTYDTITIEAEDIMEPIF